MNWDKRESASDRAEAIVALTDGIANSVDSSDLQAYADKHGIPISLQNSAKKSDTTASTNRPTPVVDDDDDDDYDDDYYESSDYNDSSCW